MEALTYQVKIIGHCGGVDSSLYHHRLDVVPDSGDIAIVMPSSNPIANQQAETTPVPLLITRKPDIIIP